MKVAVSGPANDLYDLGLVTAVQSGKSGLLCNPDSGLMAGPLQE